MVDKKFNKVTRAQHDQLELIAKQFGYDSHQMTDFLDSLGYKIHESWKSWKSNYGPKSLNSLRAFDMRDDYIWTMQKYLKKYGIGKELLERFILLATLMLGHKVDKPTEGFKYQYNFQAKDYVGTVDYFFYDQYNPTTVSLYVMYVEKVVEAIQSGKPIDEVIKDYILVYDKDVYKEPLAVI